MCDSVLTSNKIDVGEGVQLNDQFSSVAKVYLIDYRYSVSLMGLHKRVACCLIKCRRR